MLLMEKNNYLTMAIVNSYVNVYQRVAFEN